MGFWIFMLVMDLLTPLTMMGFGYYFVKSAPKNINFIFGYRTEMSMKNKDTWKFAHKYCGRLWKRCGLTLLLLSVGMMLWVVQKDIDTVGKMGSVICVIQMVVLIGTIFPTEIALKKNFDKDGNRYQK